VANYGVSTNTNNSSKTTPDKTKKKITKKKVNQLRLFTPIHDLLKISIDLQIALAADTHLAEGQWLKEQLNVLKLRMFRVGTRRPTVSRAEGQYSIQFNTYLFTCKLNSPEASYKVSTSKK
jgi:hypothetical protein